MHRFSLTAMVIALAAFSEAHGQLNPAESLKKFTVADGLQIELFAAEPDVINPTSIDVDIKGRVWVAEAVNYRRKNFGRPILRKEGDRIVVLEDVDGDGKADRSHVFYQGEEIYGPLGIAVAPYADGKGQRVFVCQSPDVLVFEDKDGDLKADGPPRKLLSGFGGFDHDHGVHGINIGPDGRLYFTVGDAGVKDLQASDHRGPKFTSNSSDCRAGTVWRCDMDGTNLELVAHNFRNNYECCINSFGEIWLSDNDDDGNQQTRICYVMPGGNYGYHPRGAGQTHWHEEQPGVVHKAMRTGFGSPTGICFYEGTLLPAKYRGELLHCDAGPREFRAFIRKPKGAGFELEKEVLVTSGDNWFRLSDCCVAPDGSVMLADWYDPGVGGHGMGDWTRGRIYRVTPTGHKGYQIPPVQAASKEQILQCLSSPCLATRYLGIQQAAAAAASDPTSWMEPLFKDNGKPLIQGRALAFYPAVPGVKVKDWSGLASQLLRQGHGAPLAIAAERIVDDFSHLLTADDWQAFQNKIQSHAAEIASALPADPAFARELLILLRKVKSPAAVQPLFFELARRYNGDDRFYLAALNIACGSDPVRRDAILAEFEKYFPDWNDKVADLVWELRPKSVLPRLGKLLADPGLSAKQRERIVEILAASDEIEAGHAMLDLLHSPLPSDVKNRAIFQIQSFIGGKWRGLRGSKALLAAIDELLAKPDTVLSGLRLIGAADAVERIDATANLALDEKAPVEVRREAVRSLGLLRSPKALHAIEKISQNKSEALNGVVVNALASQITPPPKKGNPDPLAVRALNDLGEIVLDAAVNSSTRHAAVEALASTNLGAQWLLEKHEMKMLPPDLVADAGKLLRNSPYQGLRNKALLLFPAAGKIDPKKLPPIAELAKLSGDADRGKQILLASLKSEVQCMRCHSVRGIGGSIGPDLSMIGKKASKENLFESILQPSKAIADQYLQWQIENSAGQKILGLIVEETQNAITVRDANGNDTRIAKEDVETRTKSATSLMPEELVKAINEQDLVDLVAYLSTLKSPSLTPDAWHIIGPFPNDSADKGLDTVYDPEVVKKVIPGTAYKGKSGEVKWTSVRRNPAGYIDLASFYGNGTSNHTTSYLYQEIESPVDQDAAILIGNDDGAKIWLNDEKVFENRDHLAAEPERHRVAVKLKKGINTLLIKIVNGDDPHGLYLSLSSEQELKVPVSNK